jgi:hypothetical protein
MRTPLHIQSHPFRVVVVCTTSLMLFALTLSSALSAQSPPKNLKLVGDHWTAWDPPPVVEEGSDVYVIQSGDTLWDLAEQFYSDPYLWPQIWERNQYILDAHWIYPGDPLVMGIQVEGAEDVLGQPGQRQASADGSGGGDDGYSPTMFGRESSFVQLGTPDDIYCSGFIGDLKEELSYEITGSEYEVLGPAFKQLEEGNLRVAFAHDPIKVGLDTGDIVYLDGGRSSGLAAGDVFTAVLPRIKIHHPRSGKLVGRHYSYLGRVRVLSVQDDSSIAEISHSCSPIPVGTRLRPFVEEPVPSERKTPMRPINYPEANDRIDDARVVLYNKDGILTAGQDHVIYVELGESDDVIPGDQFTVYRRNQDDQPAVILGEIAILSVHSGTSVAKVTESRYPIYPGDKLLLK